MLSTATQIRALEQMRERFKLTEYPEKVSGKPSCFALNDYTFMKYLQEHDFNVDKAESALNKLLDWRRTVRPEELSWNVEGLRRETVIMGKSKLGHPVLFARLGRWSPSMYSLDTYMKSRTLEMEESRREMARDGWKVDRLIVINDMSGYSVFNHASYHGLKQAQILMFIFGVAYPRSVEVIYLLNAPIMFQTFWGWVKRYTENDVLRRIRFVNDQSTLHELIDEDQMFVNM